MQNASNAACRLARSSRHAHHLKHGGRIMGMLFLLCASLCALAFVVTASPARAQFTATWVSATGLDSNNCQRGSPCQSLGRAITQTLSGGTVFCADPGLTIGAVTISTSVIIDCTLDYGVPANFIVSGPTININTPGINVTLRGLAIFAANTPGATHGINITAGAEVH